MTRPVATFDVRRDLVALLPRLRRFALTLAATVDEADELVRSACMSAIGKDWTKHRDGQAEISIFRLLGSFARQRKGNLTNRETLAADGCPNAIRGLALDMSPEQVSAFLLVEVEGFSYADAADILATSSDSIAMHLCDARLCFAGAGVSPSERWA